MDNKKAYKSAYEGYQEYVRTYFEKHPSALKKLEGKRIALFGVSGITYDAMCGLRKHGLKPDFVLENDDRWGERHWMGIPVRTPDYLSNGKEWVIISCTPYKHDKEMQLKSLGINDDQCIYIEPPKGRGITACWVFKALRKLKKLRETGPYHMIFCPYPGTGDAFYTGRYLPNLIDKLGWGEDYTILVTGGSFKKVMALYGYENCVVIDKETTEQLKLLISIYGEERLGVIFLLMWGLPAQNASKIEGMISINDYFQYTLFGGCKENIYRPKFNRNTDDAEKVLKDNGLVRNKTVILFPYANSFVEELDNAWWKKLASRLIDAGYIVATNCGPPSEQAIEGTARLSVPYVDFAMVAELCGYMIGIRSGIFDLLCEIDCRKIILYQNFLRKDRADSFKLRSFGITENVYEYDIKLSEGELNKLNDDVFNAVLE